MTFGLRLDDFRTLDNLVFQPLKTAGYKVFVFGSRARGNHHPFSDIDLLLEAPETDPNRTLSMVREAIEEARFPIKVDFVLNQDLADSYRSFVDQEKILV